MTQVQPPPVALACIELSSIARGFRTADEMLKRAEVRLLEAGTVCPGKFVIVIGGQVQPVRESFDAGLQVGGPAVVDQLHLPNAHPQLLPAIGATAELGSIEAVGIVETFAVATAIVAADAACKRAAVQLVELRLARGLGGKAFFTLSGELASVQAAVEAAEQIATEASGLLLRTEVIARPHAEMTRFLA